MRSQFELLFPALSHKFNETMNSRASTTRADARSTLSLNAPKRSVNFADDIVIELALEAEKEEETTPEWTDWKEWIETVNKGILSDHQHEDGELFESYDDSDFLPNDQEERWKRELVRSLHSAILDSVAYQETFNVDPDDKADKRWFSELKNSFRITPKWYVFDWSFYCLPITLSFVSKSRWHKEHDLLLLELALRYNFKHNLIHKELVDSSMKQHYRERLKVKAVSTDESEPEDDFAGTPILDAEEEMAKVVEAALESIDKLNTEEYRKQILELFEEKQWTLDEWPPNNVKRKEFMNIVGDKFGNKKMKGILSMILHDLFTYLPNECLIVRARIKIVRKHHQTRQRK